MDLNKYSIHENTIFLTMSIYKAVGRHRLGGVSWALSGVLSRGCNSYRSSGSLYLSFFEVKTLFYFHGKSKARAELLLPESAITDHLTSSSRNQETFSIYHFFIQRNVVGRYL